MQYLAKTKNHRRRKMTQRERILNYLNDGKELTRLNCWDELGILEAPARISELRSEGHFIVTDMIEVTNRYGETVKVAKWSMPNDSE
jgi:acetyl-CoA carboxylase carboxyltransferase component